MQQTQTMKSLESFNIFDPEVQENPYEYFKLLRQQAPVYKVHREGADRPTYLVTSYALVKEVVDKIDVYSSKMNELLNESSGKGKNPEAEAIIATGFADFGLLVPSDEPEHRRYRSLMGTVFTAPAVRKLEPIIEGIVDGLIDAFIERGECDFSKEFAAHLPTYMICDYMGIDRSLYEWVAERSDATLLRVGQMGSMEEEIACAKLAVEFQHFMMDMVRERRKQPGDDLVSRIVGAQSKGEEPLSDLEARTIVQEVLIGGNETARSALVSGMTRLAQSPMLVRQLHDDPSLVPAFVEEVLRLDTPSCSQPRIVAKDVELGGVQLPAGAVLNLRWDAANRDETIFPEPDAVDLKRPNLKAHFSMGAGIHYCLGNLLARKELTIAFTKLTERLSDISVNNAKSDLRHKPSLLLRVRRRLVIDYKPGPRLNQESGA